MKNLNHIRENTFILMLFFISTMPLIVNNSSQYTYLFAITSLATFLLDRKHYRLTNTPSRKFIFATALFVVFLLIEKSINDYSSSRLRTYFYSLCIIAFIGSFSVKKEKFYSVLLVATIYSLIYVAYNNKIDYIHKSQWIVTASTISAITVSIVAISIYELLTQKNNFYCKLLLTSIVSFGILASLISETRSGWLSLIITSLLTIILTRKKVIIHLKNNKLASFFIAVMSIIIIYVIIDDRVASTLDNLEKISSGEALESIGLRLEMWKSAFIITQGNYLLGLGSDFKKVMLDYANAGEISSAFLTWHPNHLHNEYLDRFVKQGVLGLSVFFIYISYSIKLASESKESMPAVILIVSLLACGLTDRSFELLEVIPLFIILTYYYLANQKTEPQ
ncbi:O-antigen ligase family protein [Vibrio sp. IRLE0018]|uniref:O-antigen ligase family protein n=1 Tax=Vibrio floridensis TaxID=2908007 RepID=UPI001F1B847E|nr:O-antigen ligase family protein [Vibrio floridensis]MCF8780178.1 O-antigen ligase family protein [Vibrio floridensis]